MNAGRALRVKKHPFEPPRLVPAIANSARRRNAVRRSLAVICVGTLLAACSGTADTGTSPDISESTASATRSSEVTSRSPAESSSTLPSQRERAANELNALASAQMPTWRSVSSSPESSALDDLVIDEDLADAQDVAAEAGLPVGDQLAAEAVDPVGWMALTIDIGRLRALNPVRMARSAAIVATAMEAAVRANQGIRASPAPRSESPELDRSVDAKVRLPSERFTPKGPADSVAAASAAASSLRTLFPVDVQRIDTALANATNAVVLSGKWSVADIAQAWESGAAVGRVVAANSAGDGSALEGNFDAAGSAKWVPTPPVYGQAVDPGAGAWTRWDQCSVDASRVARAADLLAEADVEMASRQLMAQQLRLTDGDRRLVAEWELGPGSVTPTGVWLATLSDQLQDRNIRVEDQVSALAVLSSVLADTAVEVWDLKYRFGTERPITKIRRDLNPAWSPIVVTPAFPGFPSGHSASSAAAATVLSTFFPDQAERFIQAAAEAGDSRVNGGIHFWYDNRFGIEVGSEIARSCLASWLGERGAADVLAPPDAATILDRAELASSP